MVKIIYICEKCGHEQLTGDQFWTVGVQATHHNDAASPGCYVAGKSLQVCRPCLESFGIYVRQKPNEPPVPIPSTEELIREIIARCQP